MTHAAITADDVEAGIVRLAVESLRSGNKSVDIEVRGPLAAWLEDAGEGDDHGVINPYALDVARAVLANRGSRRHS
jgi:hypothetical protein